MRTRSYRSLVAESTSVWLAVVIVAVSAGLLMPATATADSKAEQQAAIRKATTETLGRLYAVQPAAKKAIQSAAGYAVFSNFGMKLGFAGGGSGKGVAVDQKTKKETFMKMVEAQAGLGLGIKKFRLVWIFESKDALDRFVDSGWELGGQFGAGAKMGDQGLAAAGAVSVSPGVWLYQITDDGIAAEITAKGTKYYKADDLN